MENQINLSRLSDGAVAERINQELEKVLLNIADPNTDAKKPRKLQISLTFKADDMRDLANVSIQTKSTLVPAKEVDVKMVIGYDDNGVIHAAELKSGVKGQCFIDEDGDIANDTGDKVLDLRKSTR